ncbi:MAG: hypothetical protein UX83_C0010G0001, partial [Candidatus Wolfebacteria bacterium GW2011_GWE2_47_12]
HCHIGGGRYPALLWKNSFRVVNLDPVSEHGMTTMFRYYGVCFRSHVFFQEPGRVNVVANSIACYDANLLFEICVG